jgi:hypothetical protein
MKMTREQEEKARKLLQDDLKKLKVETFAMRRLFDAIPLLFNDTRDFSECKIKIAQMLNVDPCSVFIVGSSCTGISLNPNKGYKAFDDGSDIDIAIVSGYHFELGWRALRELGAGRYNLLEPAAQTSLAENKESLLYWGAIATEKILNILPFGTVWIKAAFDLGKTPPMQGRTIKFRLYRDSYSLVSYHLNNIRNLQRALLNSK